MNCYNDTFWDLHPDYRETILAVKGCIGGLSLVAVIVSLILFFMFRRYKKDRLTEIGITERLLLYNAVAAMVRSIVVILQSTEVNYDRANKAQVALCKVIGFLNQWSIWGVYLTTQMILVHMFIQMTHHGVMGISKKKIIEVFYIVFPVLFPLLFSWAPFLRDQDGYGMSGAWCWICNQTYQIVFLVAPLMFGQIISLIFILIVYPVLFFKKIKKEDRFDLIKQHGPLLLSLLLAVVFYIPGLMAFIIAEIPHENEVTELSVWILHNAIASSCLSFVSAIVILLYLLALCSLQPQMKYEKQFNYDEDSEGSIRKIQLSYGSCTIETYNDTL